ncbi:MAG: nucleotidyltransferase family protein [Desulfobacterales bacterium]|nr:nucleotidyltransferase family protein [Desulfobacterales bacterium]
MVAWQDLIKFIQSVSRKQLSRADVDHVFRFVKKEVPWDHLVVLAGIEGVDGFVYYHMNRLGLLNSLPKSVLPKLEESYARTRKRTLAILKEAEVLSTRLEKARIPVIALQGLPLIKTLYQDPGLRQLGDMDLMVKPGDKDRLKELLCQAGFLSPYPNYPDLLFKSDVLIDIHTHVLNLDRIKSRRYLFPENLVPMWEKAIPLFDQADGLLILDPCDNFIALAAHALKHSYSRLIWLVDLHEFFIKWANNAIGLDELIGRARFWHQERVVLYALILVERIFDLKIPFWVKRELGILELGMLEKHLIRLKLRGLSSNELCIALWLFNIKGIGKKLKFMKENLFPKHEIMAQIFEKSPLASNASVYAKRIGQGIILVSEDIRRALVLSFGLGGRK